MSLRSYHRLTARLLEDAITGRIHLPGPPVYGPEQCLSFGMDRTIYHRLVNDGTTQCGQAIPRSCFQCAAVTLKPVDQCPLCFDHWHVRALRNAGLLIP